MYILECIAFQQILICSLCLRLLQALGIQVCKSTSVAFYMYTCRPIPKQLTCCTTPTDSQV